MWSHRWTRYQKIVNQTSLKSKQLNNFMYQIGDRKLMNGCIQKSNSHPLFDEEHGRIPKFMESSRQMYKFVINFEYYQKNIYFNIIMKKPSIATTVDEDFVTCTSPRSRTISRLMPQFVPKQYIEINYSCNWLYRCLGVAYLIECVNNPEECDLLFQKLETKQIDLNKCKNILSSFKQIYRNQNLMDHISSALEYTKSKVKENKQKSQKVQDIFNFIERRQKINFSIIILVRSIAIYQAQDIINEKQFQFLGNQIDVLRDFSANPSYKVLNLLSEIFNYQIKVKSYGGVEPKNILKQHQNSSQLNLIKYQQRLFLWIQTLQLQQQSLFKISSQTIPEVKIIKSQTDTKDTSLQIDNNSTLESESRFMTNCKKRSKDFFFDGEDHNLNSKQEGKERIKYCLSCGESRSQNQRFCDCKKRKIITPRNISS